MLDSPLAHEEKQFDFHDYIRILFRGRWIIAFCFVSVLAITLYLNKKAIPVYNATITLMSEEFRRESMVALGGGATWGYFVGDKPINNKQIILKSVKMGKEVAQFLKRSPQADQLEFLRTESGRLRDDNSIATILQKRIEVSFVKDSDIITFTALGYGKNGAEEAAIIANAYGDVFYERSFREMRGEIFEVKKFLEDQIERYKIDLEKSEEMLKDYKERENMAELNTETSQLITQLNRVEYSYNEVMTNLESNKKRLEYITSQLDERKRTLPDDIGNVTSPMLKQLRSELSQQEAQYSKYLSQGVPEDHEQMTEIRGKIKDIKGRLRAEAEGLLSEELMDPIQTSTKLVTDILSLNIEIESDRVRVEELRRLRDRYDQEMMTLPAKSLTLARLTRRVGLYSDLYILLTKRYEEMRITEAGKLNNVSIIDRARPDRKPIKPNKTKNILMGILVGLGLGIGITLTIEFLDTTLKSPDEVEKLTKLSVVGAIPKIKISENSGSGRQNRLGGTNTIQQIESRLITHFAPKSPVAEAYRTLRTNIQFISPDKNLKTLVATSSNPKEGKSTTIANLAIALAQMDTKVILLDTDFRRPIVHSLFNIPREPGLTSVLLEQRQIEEIIHKTEIDNLYVIPCGVIPPNPSELLGSNRMKAMIARLKGMFEIVLFDSPPIIAVTDAQVLGSEVDGVLLVVQEGKTRRQDVLKAKDLLENVKANIFGVVLNIIDIQRKYGYYYYYYYYYYHDYYTYGEDSSSKPRWWKRRKKA